MPGPLDSITSPGGPEWFIWVMKILEKLKSQTWWTWAAIKASQTDFSFGSISAMTSINTWESLIFFSYLVILIIIIVALCLLVPLVPPFVRPWQPRWYWILLQEVPNKFSCEIINAFKFQESYWWPSFSTLALQTGQTRSAQFTFFTYWELIGNSNKLN